MLLKKRVDYLCSVRTMFLERKNEVTQNNDATRKGAGIEYKAIVPPIIGPTI